MGQKPVRTSKGVTTISGAPLGGVVMHLSGAHVAVTITDSLGRYSFPNIDTDSFYNVAPELANFTFTPPSLSFSLVADKVDAVFTGTPSAQPTANPIDTAEFFVRQQYLDFLGREPDRGGFEYWSARINQGNGDAACLRSRRIGVSAAFFVEQEFQQTGSFIYDLYAGALGRRPLHAEYAADRQQVIGGVSLDSAKTAFAQSFVQRVEFAQRYPASLSADSFVEALIQSVGQASGIDLRDRRNGLLAVYAGGTDQIHSRALVLRSLADDAGVKQAEYNSAFVLAEYFGYLRRDPDQPGYDFWLNVLQNADPNNYRGMVCSFITSTEYQRRFGSVITQSNATCAGLR